MSSLFDQNDPAGKTMEFLLGFGIGMSLGSCVGMMAAALLRMSKEGDRQLELAMVDESAPASNQVGDPPMGRGNTLSVSE